MYGDYPAVLEEVSPAGRRVYDALDDADGELSREDIEDVTHHAGSTVTGALNELREHGLAERSAVFPKPQYSLLDAEIAAGG